MLTHKDEVVSGNVTMHCLGILTHCSAVSGVAVVGEGGMRTELRNDVQRRVIRYHFLLKTDSISFCKIIHLYIYTHS